MARFDANDGGEISLDERERAREEAQRVAARAGRRLQGGPPLFRLTKTDDPRRPFLISTFGERRVVPGSGLASEQEQRRQGGSGVKSSA
jgi:hypothetical protein